MKKVPLLYDGFSKKICQIKMSIKYLLSSRTLLTCYNKWMYPQAINCQVYNGLVTAVIFSK